MQYAHSLEYEIAHSLENEPQTDAERNNLAQNLCRTEQFGPESMQNAAIGPRINAERSKMTLNQCRTQQIDRNSMLNAANPPTTARRVWCEELLYCCLYCAEYAVSGML